ncbi:hypothetical protein MMC13_003922 [Lambiella insularis]|nr:hypothetical protein [Lambiella insularis]
MTTGASDAHRTVKPHFERLRQFRYYGVASDKELEIDGIHVMDMVKISPPCYLEPDDLRYYSKLQNTTATQEALEEANEPDPAWRLARIVFYGAFERMYKLFPRAKWYLIMDNDTWVDAKGLQRYLRRYNPRLPYYLGSVALFDEIAFAHGGSLVTISAKAMEMAQNSEPHRSPRNEQWGDFTLALQLRQAGVNLTWLPMVKGRSPTETDFSREEWCQPFLTLHHVTPEYLEKLDSLRTKVGANNLFENAV